MQGFVEKSYFFHVSGNSLTFLYLKLSKLKFTNVEQKSLWHNMVKGVDTITILLIHHAFSEMHYPYFRSQIKTVWSIFFIILTRTCRDGRFIYNKCNNNRHVTFVIWNVQKNTLCPILFAQHFCIFMVFLYSSGLKQCLLEWLI